MRLFRRGRAAAIDCSLLGSACVAVRAGSGAVVPGGALGIVHDQAGRIRRVDAGARIVLAQGETAACFHPGPYRSEIVPFAAAPEIGLALSFAIDTADPRIAQQRFDLYLAAEVTGDLSLAGLSARMEEALRRELAQGNLELPPCTQLAEWNVFRAGVNRLLYTRFGVTVDDCLPVDLGERVDYAALLRSRAEALPEIVAVTPAPTPAPAFDAVSLDRQALRRLFLELPRAMCAFRLATPAPGLFGVQRALLQRLDLASVQIASMPALTLAAPNQPAPAAEQERRARASMAAAATLDEAWAWLARAQGDCGAARFDEFDRIAANLEYALAQRREVTA